MPCLQSGTALDRPEATKLPPIPEFVRQQTQETHSIDIHNKSTHNINPKNDVEAQTLPKKETSSRISGSNTESLLENQTRITPVLCLNDSNKQQHEIRRNETDMTIYDKGDDNISAPK